MGLPISLPPSSPNSNRTNFEILESLYKNTKGIITNTEQEILLSIGTRQGAIESPMIWALWIDWILRIYLYHAKQKGIKFLELEYRINQQATKRDMKGQRFGKTRWS